MGCLTSRKIMLYNISHTYRSEFVNGKSTSYTSKWLMNCKDATATVLLLSVNLKNSKEKNSQAEILNVWCCPLSTNIIRVIL